MGVESYALTGAAPNPLASVSDHALVVDCEHTATVQEIHLIAVHLLCAAVDVQLEALGLRGEVAS